MSVYQAFDGSNFDLCKHQAILFFFLFFFCFFFVWLFVCLFFVFLSASGPLLLQDTWYVLFPVTLEAYAF